MTMTTKPINPINPEKIKLSKWTATKPRNKEKHWLVSKLLRDENEQITGCELEAVINKRVVSIDWRELKDPANWTQGWV